MTKSIADLEKMIHKEGLDYKPKETPQVVMEDALIGPVPAVKRASFHVSAYGRRAILIGIAVILATLGTLIILQSHHQLSPRAEALRIGVFLPIGIILGSVLTYYILILLGRIFTPFTLYILSGLLIAGEVISLITS